MTVKGLMLSELTQVREGEHCIISLARVILDCQTHGLEQTDNRGYQGSGGCGKQKRCSKVDFNHKMNYILGL